MDTNLEVFIERIRQTTKKEELRQIKLDLISYIGNLGQRFANNLQLYSDSVIKNKEEWWKSSMTECVHRAGRETGYLHEANKVEIEATKALLAFIYDMESEGQDVQAEEESEKDTSL